MIKKRRLAYIVCDGCKKEMVDNFTEETEHFRSETEAIDGMALKGWQPDGHGKDYCPDCKGKFVNE